MCRSTFIGNYVCVGCVGDPCVPSSSDATSVSSVSVNSKETIWSCGGRKVSGICVRCHSRKHQDQISICDIEIKFGWIRFHGGVILNVGNGCEC